MVTPPGRNGAAGVGRMGRRRLCSGVGSRDMEDWLERSDRGRGRRHDERQDAADLITWRDFEALRNEMRSEFRIEDDDLRGTVEEINQKLDATNETVTTMTDQMTDI
ncbi:hypothetical protein QYE76_045511 [Lolium multiflorum]|uniref:Uncharacterized protein n=1 Tax=Lolium multiflorum TaxID=4521 RepID=A0AAD8X051_LOLMU|nr:hypothetical protein QYE76_045511 [Lolium multiflorum]